MRIMSTNVDATYWCFCTCGMVCHLFNCTWNRPFWHKFSLRFMWDILLGNQWESALKTAYSWYLLFTIFRVSIINFFISKELATPLNTDLCLDLVSHILEVSWKWYWMCPMSWILPGHLVFVDMRTYASYGSCWVDVVSLLSQFINYFLSRTVVGYNTTS